MITDRKKLQVFFVVIWIAEFVLSIGLTRVALSKIFLRIETLVQMWAWVAMLPVGAVRFLGFIDLIAAFGIILPTMLHAKPKVTVIAAVSIFIIMMWSVYFGLMKRDLSSVWMNVFFAVMAGFIVYGRLSMLDHYRGHMK